jgi:hypothetical protein
VDIAAQGNSTCWQIVSHKNLEHFDRNRFIGGFNLGERDFNTNYSETNNGMTASAKKPVKVKVEDN